MGHDSLVSYTNYSNETYFIHLVLLQCVHFCLYTSGIIWLM